MLIAAVVTVLISCGLCVAAVLAHAPVAALPLVVAVCVGGPIFAAWELRDALDTLRADRADRAGGKALLASLRVRLDELPEIEHPLGF